jgi:transcriptional regulator with XRE-family HTH domain
MNPTHPSQRQILSELGERIAELRRRAGLTQEQLSELSDIDIQAIQRAETGRAALSLERLACIASTFRVDLAHLFALRSQVAVAPDWDPEEAQLLATFRAVPADRRALVLPLVAVLARAPTP